MTARAREGAQTTTVTRYLYGDSLEEVVSLLSPGYRKEATVRRLAAECGQKPAKITVTVEMLPESEES